MTTEKPLHETEVACLHCEETIERSDVWTFTRHKPAPKGIAAVHVACTASGVRRWLREGKPHSSPLEAARTEGWAFTAEADGSVPFGRPGHTVAMRLDDARRGRLKYAPDPVDS